MEIALVTGTSSGIGFATAIALAKAGYQVYAGMRSLSKAAPLAEAAAGLPVEILEMDVTSQASVDAAFERIALRALWMCSSIMPALGARRPLSSRP